MSDPLKHDPPTKEGLYSTGKGQIWELGDDGLWFEVHDDSAEFAEHPFFRMVTVEQVIELIDKYLSIMDMPRDQLARRALRRLRQDLEKL